MQVSTSQLSTSLTAAADAMAEVVANVKPTQLSAPTPCAAFDVGALVAHLLAWSPIIEGVGWHKSATVDRDAAGRPVVDGVWQAEYEDWLRRIVVAWTPASAWQGIASVNGTEVPAEVIGAKTVVELVVHGWDLARATGQVYCCDDELAERVRRVIEDTAEETRALGMFGAPVAAAPSAGALDRALATSGRDPNWTPPGI